MSQEYCWQFSSWSHACWLEKNLLFFFLFLFLSVSIFSELKHVFWLELLCSADKRRCWTKPWTEHWLQLHTLPTVGCCLGLLTPSWWPGPKILQLDELEVSAWASWGLGEWNRLVAPREIQDLGSHLFLKPRGRKLSFWRWPRAELLSLAHLCLWVPKEK